MGNALGKLFGVTTPKYSQSAATQSAIDAANINQQYAQTGMTSPFGSVSWSGTGANRTMNVDLSAEDKQRQALVNSGLSSLNLDPTAAAQQSYDAQTNLLKGDYAQQATDLNSQLVNQGIGIGGEAYSNAMGSLQKQQDLALSDIAKNAMFTGQDYVGGNINNIGALSSQMTNPASFYTGGTNAGVGNSYNDYFNAKSQRSAQQGQALQTALGLGASAFAASDIRFKENLKPVGKLDNGLVVYIGNYKKETGLDTRPQLFLIAQEVEKIYPEAVKDIGDGYLAVDYKKAVE
jgi:hypothetical protein